MRRREFITLLGGAAGVAARGARAAGERMRRIGVLVGFAESDPESSCALAAFRRGLKNLGGRRAITFASNIVGGAGSDPHASARSELIGTSP